MSSEIDSSTQGLLFEGTKLQIVEAALETLKSKGFAHTSAREIARAGDFNQALIFYHFGSVEKLLLAVVDETSARRMAVYRPKIESAQTLPEFVEVARDIYEEDVDKGYITVLVEVVSGSASSPDFAREVVARMEPWIDLAEEKVAYLLGGTPFEALAKPRDLAFGLIAFYLGIDMMTHLDGDRSRPQALLDLGARLSAIAAGFLPPPGQGRQSS